MIEPSFLQQARQEACRENGKRKFVRGREETDMHRETQ